MKGTVKGTTTMSDKVKASATKTAMKASYNKLTGVIALAVKGLVAGINGVHEAGVECIKHAQMYGDARPAAMLMQEVKAKGQGYVNAGLVAWFQKNSPIKLTVDDKGQVKANILKPGDKGYNAFDVEKAANTPAHTSREVQNRTDRPIEPFSIKMVKARITSLLNQLDKAQQPGGRGIVGDPSQIKTYIAGIISYAEKVTVIGEAPKAERPRKVRHAKGTQTQASTPIKAVA